MERVDVSSQNDADLVDTPIESITSGSSSTKKRKSIQPRSVHWKHFDKFFKDGQAMARSHNCQKEIRAGSQNGTAPLKNHLPSCRGRASSDGKQLELIGLSTATSEKVLGTYKFDSDTVRKALVKMIILDELPFKFVMGLGFKSFMEVACPKFHIPSRWTIQRDCFQMFTNEKAKLQEFFRKSSQSVSITTDTWTSIQKLNYMCVTAHFIDDDWNLQKKLLSFVPIFSHKGNDIGEALELCLRDWGIHSLFIVTMHNASANEVAVNYLRDKHKSKLVLDERYIHMRCVARILNLIVIDGTSMHGVFDAIRKVRAVVKYIKNSCGRYALFKRAVSMEDITYKGWLSLDVATRWNSTYKMLDAAQKLQKAFVRYEQLDRLMKFELKDDNGSEMLPTHEDWATVKRLVNILRRFYNSTLKVSGSKSVSAHSFFHDIANRHALFRKWKESDDIDLTMMASQMAAKYDKYWGAFGKINMLYFAVVLDPRQKLKFLRFTLLDKYEAEKGEQLFENVKSALYELYNYYKCKFAPAHSQAMTSGLVNSQLADDVDDDDDSDEKMMRRRRYRFKKAEQIDGESNKSELDKYLAEDLEDDIDSFDILAWWKVLSYILPILGRMARNILSIPISTVASESSFSTGGRVLDSFRSSLSLRIVESLLCIQDWLQDSYSPIGIEEDTKDIEQLEDDFEKMGVEGYSHFEDISRIRE